MISPLMELVNRNLYQSTFRKSSLSLLSESQLEVWFHVLFLVYFILLHIYRPKRLHIHCPSHCDPVCIEPSADSPFVAMSAAVKGVVFERGVYLLSIL